MRTSISTSFSLDWVESRVATPSTTLRIAKGSETRLNWPASSLEKSRMSFRIVSRDWLELWMISASVRWCAVRSVWASMSDMPTMPFMGVRISWLILARNSDLERAVCSATSRATFRSRALVSSWP